MKERQEAGFLVSNQMMKRNYIITAYIDRFDEPDKNEWSEIAKQLSNEIKVKPATVIATFQKLREDEPNPERQRPGAGRPLKLARDNTGLVTAAVALNSGAPVSVVTELCNLEKSQKA